MICEELFKGRSPEAERVMQMVTAYAKRLKVQALFKPYNNPYTHFPNEIELTDFFAQKTGTGAGTKIMQFLAKLADQYGLNVYCHPESGRNTEFYGRFGFVRSSHHGMLVRYPPMPDEDDERDDDWEDWKASQRAKLGEETAFHGSNNDFQEFSVDHIGSGQGRSTFGWGIYVTKHKPIARRYRKSGGKIYHVDIPDDSEFLSWELPLSQQPPRVQAALKKLGYEKIRQKMIDDEMVAGYQTGKTDTDTGENIHGIIVSALLSKPEPGNFFANYQADQKKASMKMLKAGIAGIKHLDPDTGSPRNGQYNYVIFDPRRIKIVKTTKT